MESNKDEIVTVIIRKPTATAIVKVALICIFCPFIIIFGAWLTHIVYPETEVEIKISKEKYLEYREKYLSCKLYWRYPSKEKYKKKYLFLPCSKLLDEERELAFPHTIPRNMPTLD